MSSTFEATAHKSGNSLVITIPYNIRTAREIVAGTPLKVDIQKIDNREENTMNYKQIKELSNGDCLELQEDYEYKRDIAPFTLKKGTRMVVVSRYLGGTKFSIEQEGIERHQMFGKKRLYEMKLKKIGVVHL